MDLIVSGCPYKYHELADKLGYLHGHSSDAGEPRWPITDFLDSQNYRNVDIALHLQVTSRLEPKYAVLPDVFSPLDVPATLLLAEEFHQYATFVIIVPKAEGIIELLPRLPWLVIGLSVPTSHGGWFTWLYLYAGRLVHLLGGGPAKQYQFAAHLMAAGAKVISADSNYIFRVAQFGKSFQIGQGRGARWSPAQDIGERVVVDVPYTAAERSLIANRRMWEGLL